jgi:hypothetical protein
VAKQYFSASDKQYGMLQPESTFIAKAYNPFLQAAVTLGAALIVILGAKLVNLSGIIEVPARFPWMTAAVFMLCYALFNSVFSLSANNMMKYWGRSVYSFMGLAFFSGLLAWLFSSLTISEAGSYRWIFIVVTVAYLVFLSVVAIMRKIVDFAQREEWNHPRIRRRKSSRSNNGEEA